ncbi:cytochrome c biogenesis protein ResB [Egicoccus sp. AB-alg6-2]|uniref:cytochrome c biogenesis protein ResB n=1 Tax=Egicoccus sp. AB-alg6-2 TaxID=3242692 RepID=UPI00359DBE6F
MSRTDSAAPPEANPQVRPPRRGGDGPLGFVWSSVVMGWRWLVRMRTALYLLGLLGLETLIATVVPQEPNVAATVDAWRTGAEGPGTLVSGLIDLVGGYDVYGSPAFLALLLLLFLSLTACLIPRIRAWVRLVRYSRPPLTRSAGRQEVVARLTTSRGVDEAHRAAADLLRANRWRVRTETDAGEDGVVESGPPPQVAAEKGLWSREGGSLLFHLSFYVLLAAIVFGQLLSFEGQRAVVEGERFADTPVSYWTYGPGRWWGEDSHRGWILDLEQFHVDWVRDPLAPGAGQPTLFRSDVEVTRPDGSTRQTVIEGNRPLVVDGMKIHQLDWGYAPLVQVEVDGELVYEDYLTATATDAGHFRAAVKAPSADPDLGMSVFFYPYAPDNEAGEPVPTGAPFADAPLVLFQLFRGDLQLGRTPQTINELDTSALESAGGAWLREGAEVDMGDGVVVRFVELRRWVGFQVSARPQIPYLLLASGMLLAGLWPALYAFRRRLWVVAERDPGSGHTIVTVAGRAFQRPQAFDDEHAAFVTRLARHLDATPSDADDPDRILEPVSEEME